MQNYNSVIATGASGVQYEFQVFPLGAQFKEVPGLYIFANPLPNGQWRVVYIGQTHNLQERVGSGLSTHHKILQAKNLGATYIGVRGLSGREVDRLNAEADLIASHTPILNDVIPKRHRWI